MSLLFTDRERAWDAEWRLRSPECGAPRAPWRFHLAYAFRSWRWVRRSFGGKWELWRNKITCSDMWEPVPDFHEVTGWRPPCCWSRTAKEEWPR